MKQGVILLSKLISKVSQTTGKGSGSTLPGHLALKLKPSIAKDLLVKNPQLKIVLVAGTNGKTTTSTLLKYILEKNDLKVIQNDSGANLLNGIVSTLLLNAQPNGEIPYDVAIFEVDENSLPVVLEYIKPSALVLLNLFRDQLDRYGEVNTIADKWNKAIQKLPESSSLFINGDDPGLRLITDGSKTKPHYFSVDEKLLKQERLGHDVDFVYCPRCGKKLNFKKIAYSHIGKYICPNCKLTNPKIYSFSQFTYPLHGLYNIYNTNAAILTAMYQFDITDDQIKETLKTFQPAFGRQEIIEYKDRQIMVLLSKNPAGFNQSLEVVNDFKQKNDKTVLLVLNDQIPDGRDVSWIWDVDFEKLKASHIVVSGDRTYDLALRMQYTQKSQALNNTTLVEEDLQKAIEQAVKLTKQDDTLFILPTYSAMLETRKILLGRKIL